MADITRRIAGKAASYLEDGEVVQAVVLCEPKGTLGVTSAAMVALPRVTSKVLADRATEAYAAAGGMARGLPGKPFVVIATDRRVLVAASNGLRLDEPCAAYPLGALRLEVLPGGFIGRKLRLAFVDGTEAVVDVQRGQPLERAALAVAGSGAPPKVGGGGVA